MLQAWSPVGSQAIDLDVHQPGALGMCAQAAGALIWVCTDLSFRCVLGLLIPSHSPGAEGVGAQEARATVENSLNSH